MKEPQPYAVLSGNGAQSLLGFIERPITRHVARVLSRVAVAEHDLLQVSPLFEGRTIERVSKQPLEHLRCFVKVVYGLEERRHPETVLLTPPLVVDHEQAAPARQELHR